mmetsp:Transcript_61208/g.113621  ORF Transcript_61208/g.113621 Transcript_61208/m.113621 type:complete len:672 (+) Transcript_61208:55-2070(+)
MKVSVVVLLLCLGAAHAVTPVQKVIEMLTSMKAKGAQEKHEEQVQFAAYKQFCDDTSAEKTRAIKEAGEQIDMLTAEIEKLSSDAARLAKEIAGHDADIAAWTGDIKAATEVRGFEKADYKALHEDYSESVDALQRAIQVLKAQAYDRKQAMSLSQVARLKDMTMIPVEAKKAIAAFLAEDPDEPADELDVAAPEANAYEFQSSHIVEILEKLLDKFVDERTDLEKAEMNAQHAFDMLKEDLTAEIGQATQDRSSKTEFRAQALQSKADSEGQLTDTSNTKKEDEKYLADLTATCKRKAGDFESRQQLRTEELDAISKAIEILSSEEVSGHAEKYLPSLIAQKKVASALAQVRGSFYGSQQSRAATFLQDRAAKLNSRVLSALAVRVADDPFEKVKKMIQDLIVRLMEEANEEAEHKGWCDTELSTNEQTRTEKTAAVEMLHAETDALKASIAKLTEELTVLHKDVATLQAEMAEATKLRLEEKATLAQTVKDAQEAQAAVAQALLILEEFYAKAGDATSLVQHHQQPVPPPIFDKAYKGMAAESGGVIAMLEVIQSDFARLEAETSAAEVAAENTYDEYMTDSKVAKAQKDKDIQHKTAEKQEDEQDLITKTSDLEGTQQELDAALAYYDKLKPSCVDAGQSYDDRVSRRKEEIESLQEALRILNGEEIA